MPDRIDDLLTRFTGATTAISPDPPVLAPVNKPRPMPALAAAGAFILVLIVGLVTFVMFALNGDEEQLPAGTPIVLEARWEWMTTDATHALGIVAVTRVGPEPEFDVTQLGQLLDLVPVTELPGRAGPPVTSANAVDPVAYIGTIVDTSTRVFAWRAAPSRSPTLCIATESPDRQGAVCLDDLERFGADGRIVASHSYSRATYSADRVEISAQVDLLLPEATSYVLAEFDDGRRIYQQPVGGIAVIQLDDAGTVTRATVTAFDIGGDVLRREEVTFDTSS